jgi:CRP-like cAMP-binding protein
VNTVADEIKIFSEVELFRGLTPEQMARLATIARREVYHTGETVFLQETPGDSMYIVKQGQVEVRIDNEEGESYPAVYLGRGQVFGEMALVDQGTRSATVIAVEAETEVYAIPGNQFTSLCENDTAIGYILMRNMAQDMSFKLRHRHLDHSEDQEG